TPPTLLPYTTLCRSVLLGEPVGVQVAVRADHGHAAGLPGAVAELPARRRRLLDLLGVPVPEVAPDHLDVRGVHRPHARPRVRQGDADLVLTVGDVAPHALLRFRLNVHRPTRHVRGRSRRTRRARTRRPRPG